MLIGTFTALYLLFWTSSSTPMMANLQQTEQRIKANVADDARRQQALQIVGRMNDANKAYSEQSRKVIKSLTALIGKRTTQPAAIEAALDPLLADDKTTREQLLDLRIQLKSVLTVNEWGAVFAPPKTAPAAGTRKTFALPRAEGHRS